MTADRYHEEEALGKAYDARLMKRLLRYLKRYRWAVLAAVILLLLLSTLQIAVPYLIQRAIDDFIVVRDLEGLGGLGLVFLLIMILGAGVRYFQTYLTFWLGQKVLHDIRCQVFAHIQRLSLSYFDRNPVGRLLTKIGRASCRERV